MLLPHRMWYAELIAVLHPTLLQPLSTIETEHPLCQGNRLLIGDGFCNVGKQFMTTFTLHFTELVTIQYKHSRCAMSPNLGSVSCADYL